MTVFDYIASKFVVGTPFNSRGRNSDDTAPLLRLFEAAPRRFTPAAHEPILRPADRLVVSYRDRKTVCGMGISGAHTVAALRRSGVDLVDLDYSLPPTAIGRNGCTTVGISAVDAGSFICSASIPRAFRFVWQIIFSESTGEIILSAGFFGNSLTHRKFTTRGWEWFMKSGRQVSSRWICTAAAPTCR